MHLATYNSLQFKMLIYLEIFHFSDVEQGAVGQDHPPDHVGWQLSLLLLLTDNAPERPSGPVFEGKLPHLLSARSSVLRSLQILALCLASFTSSLILVMSRT